MLRLIFAIWVVLFTEAVTVSNALAISQAGNVALSSAVDSYLIEANNGNRHSSRARENDLRRFCEHASGEGIEDVAQISAAHIASFLATLSGRGEAPSTVARRFANVRAFFARIHADGVVRINPASRIRAPRVARDTPRFFTDEEITALKAACVDSRERAIVETLHRTGVRCGELCRLTLGSLNQVEWKLTGIPCKATFFREVPLHHSAREAILAYLPERDRAILSRDGAHHALPEAERRRYPLFVSPRGAIGGEPRSFAHNEKSIWNLVQRLGARAGVADAHPHRFRHSCVMEFYRQTLDIRLTQQFIGHASVTMTERYTVRDKEEIADAIKRMG